MNSQIINVETAEIISNLKSGQIVTLPTETVEGYAVRLSDIQAIKLQLPGDFFRCILHGEGHESSAQQERREEGRKGSRYFG